MLLSLIVRFLLVLGNGRGVCVTDHIQGTTAGRGEAIRCASHRSRPALEPSASYPLGSPCTHLSSAPPPSLLTGDGLYQCGHGAHCHHRSYDWTHCSPGELYSLANWTKGIPKFKQRVVIPRSHFALGAKLLAVCMASPSDFSLASQTD